MADVGTEAGSTPDQGGLLSGSDRGVSTTLGYTLNLAVATVLVTGLLMSAGGYVEQQQERAIRSELEVIGARVAGDIGAVDRLARTGDDASVTMRVEVPTTTAGARYRLSINESGNDMITLRTQDPAVSVSLPYASTTQVQAGSVSGGTFIIRYDPATDSVVISDA